MAREMQNEKDEAVSQMRREIQAARSALEDEQRARHTYQVPDPCAGYARNGILSGDQPRQMSSYSAAPNMSAPREQSRSPPRVPQSRDLQSGIPSRQRGGGKYDVPLPRQMLFDGRSPYESFIRPFVNMADMCGWDNQERAFRLIGGLRGEAADFVFNQLSPDMQESYDDLQRALASRFRERRSATSFLTELENRKLNPQEKLIEYASDIKRLVRKSYPTADDMTFDTIALRHFLKGLGNQQMILAVGMKNPQTINEACDILETYKSLCEDSHGKTAPGPRMRVIKNPRGPRFVTESQLDDFKTELHSSIDNKFDDLTSVVKSLVNGEKPRPDYQERRRRNIATVECFKCHEMGHYANDCHTLDRYVPARDGANDQEN